MKTRVLFLCLLSLLPFWAGAQYLPHDDRSPLERQPVQISMPDNVNFFTLQQPLSGDENRFEFDSLNVSYVGSWALGQSLYISCNGPGNILFVGSGAGVIVLDVTIPSNPVHLGEIHTRGLVDAIYFDETTSRLYLCTYFSGFEIWDVSDYADPVRLGRGATSGLPRGGIFASGNYVYVVTVANGVQVFDISNPAAPVNTGNCPLSTTNFAWNSAKSGNNIFVAIGNGGLKIVDVSDPTNPKIAGSSSMISTGVWVEGNYAYSVGYNFGIRILNISNLSNITQVGYKTIPGYPFRIKVIGNYAYIANASSSDGGINVVDISTPTSPQFLSTYAGYAEYVTGNGSVVAFTGSSQPCTILDITEPVNPVFAGSYPLPLYTQDVEVSGNYAYTGNKGFRVFDISDKTQPVQVGYDTTDGSIIRLAGDKAVYIRASMAANNPVMIMDISNPLQPGFLGQYMAPVMTWDLALKDQLAYVATWWDGVRSVDFQDPVNPVLFKHFFGWFTGAVPGEDYCYVQALDIEGDYLYLVDYGPFVAEDTRGLYIFNISDPANPVKVSRYTGLLSNPYDIDVVGDYVYIADQNGGMEVIDVTLKQIPVALGYVSLPDAPREIRIHENHAFLADYINGGVQIVNVSDPNNPVIDGYYSRSGCFALGVSVSGNYIYLADGLAGFQIYQTDLITGTGKPITENDRGPSVYPNPFTDRVGITIEQAGNAHSFLSVYDASGRLLATLLPISQDNGSLVYSWNGKTTSGMEVVPGFYYYKLNTGTISGKILKLK
ncbi:MAG: T9SS type A sorting domain-containing protein [Bacteroidales bacterium]|nr:T9SS type A sorting domain-containing protein [Bacteroidales bacterium]